MMDKPDNAQVFLKGYIDVPDNRLATVREALPEHIALTRAEKGCIAFEITEDNLTTGRFNVSEIFENQGAFEVHQTRTRHSDWFTITAGIPRQYSVTIGKREND